MRWVAQVSEYWPIDHLANLKEAEMDQVLSRYANKAISDEGYAGSVVDDGGENVTTTTTTSVNPSSDSSTASSTVSTLR